MKVNEIIDLSIEEIQVKLAELEKDLGDLMFKHSLKQLENPMSIRLLRRDIARVKTILKQKGVRV
ncbi:MAG: 50S ribosomal protein L29 [Candidatus Cloacimonadota bacterium]|nr:MAG: 50S ribosomal protein L29 [Candidatus Cloacimonadota bacterium]PIE79128.1 MAG: 50S ribosomal protein L29 [Candidatus Delongbacteria bacterium]